MRLLPVAAIPVAAALSIFPHTAQAASFSQFVAEPTILVAQNVDQVRTARVGDVLTCHPGAIAATGTWTYRYKWERDAFWEGAITTPDATDGNDTYTVTQDDVKDPLDPVSWGYIGCVVEVLDENDIVIGQSSLSGSYPDTFSNQVEARDALTPQGSEGADLPYVQLSDAAGNHKGDGEPYQYGDTLSCEPSSNGTINPLDVTSIQYEWFRDENDDGNFLAISGETGRLLVTGDESSMEIPPRVRCDYTVNTLAGSYSYSSYPFVLYEYLRTNVDQPTLTVNAGADPTWGQVLTCQTQTALSATHFDDYRYYFLIDYDRDGNIDEYSPGLAGFSNEYTITRANLAHAQIACQVEAHNDDENPSFVGTHNSSNSLWMDIADVAHRPVIGILGDTRVGQTLTCEPGLWNTGDGSAALVWTIDNVQVGAGATYVIQSADETKRIRCESALSDGSTEVARERSAPSNIVGPMQISPQINLLTNPTTGSETVSGAVLSCSLGADTTSLANVTIGYEWLLNGAVVSSAQTFTLNDSHIGSTIACRVTLASDEVNLVVKTQTLTVRSTGATGANPSPNLGLNPDPNPTPQQLPLDACAPTSDLIIGTPAGERICGGPGNDIIYGGGGNDVITGNDGADTIYAGNGNDRVNGNGGNDTIYGQGGADRLLGGSGNDILYQGAGGGLMFGQDGNDRLNGASGQDRASGGNGNDWISLGSGNDHALGGSGVDLIFLGGGNDFAHGGAGSDSVFGLSGDDRLLGGDGSDRLNGGEGNDKLYGQNDLDVLYGGPGNDLLSGGAGLDTIYGNSGLDVILDRTRANGNISNPS